MYLSIGTVKNHGSKFKVHTSSATYQTDNEKKYAQFQKPTYPNGS